MDNLFSFFDLTLWTIYEPSLWPHCIIIWSFSKTSSSFRNFTWSLINSDNITSYYFLFLYRIDHFLTKIIYCLHLCCLKCDFTSFCSRCWRFLYLYLYDLSLYDLTLLFYSYTNRSSESLCQCLGFAHLKRKYLRTRQHCKWHIFT